jgi:glycerophosphoryl diester phosphodiesterase
MPLWLDRLFLGAVDAAFERVRYPLPTAAQLERCRIVSHRGERDDRAVFENTYAAFDPLRGSGVFGIEFDVRWTADLVPVVFHDPDLARLFGDRTSLCKVSRAALRRLRPDIPDLHDFVRRYADDFHLMVEVKEEPYPDVALQNRRFCEALAPALATGRCHVLSLAPEIFDWLPGVPAARTMGVARLNAWAISADALARRRGGFSGHYLWMTRAQIARHHAAGQSVGCGFPASAAVLYREAARGVDYVFTNLARQAEAWRQAALALARTGSRPAGSRARHD